jgi:succinyl-CoA synthetase alpha subunit
VFLFSDNVSIEDEVDLKRRAQEHELLVMGPDCGTAMLNGVGLGFANVARRGSVGIVGASGTGIQEIVSLVHEAGGGISHAIGTGSRDLHSAVGGTTSLQAIRLLADDPTTQTIVLVSKPSDPDVASRVLDALAATGKRAVACLLGSAAAMRAGVETARTLEAAAHLAVGVTRTDSGVAAPTIRLTREQRQVRGLFCGGTLCEEAAEVVDDRAAHEFIDFGDDRYTHGRAHPMLDPTLRNQAIVQTGADPRVAVLLLDVILGLGAHPDPAGAAAPAIREARSRAAAAGGELAVLAHIVGTEWDPQDLARQTQSLQAVGTQVFGSNYQAARAAKLLVEAAAV